MSGYDAGVGAWFLSLVLVDLTVLHDEVLNILLAGRDTVCAILYQTRPFINCPVRPRPPLRSRSIS